MGPELYEQVCYALYSTSRTVTQAYKPLLKPLNLTYPQYVVMMALWGKDAVSISEVAQITRISNATLTPLLKRLEINGFVERKTTETDERQKSIVLTSSGKRLGMKAKKASELALCATGLGDKDVIKLLSLCQKIKNNLDSL
ncbi:MAG: MarR family transcriptional regulator [Proteobacteria bacterium]|nr:MarR family transcriptional regulator [Pseudomonadota bacterium]